VNALLEFTAISETQQDGAVTCAKPEYPKAVLTKTGVLIVSEPIAPQVGEGAVLEIEGSTSAETGPDDGDPPAVALLAVALAIYGWAGYFPSLHSPRHESPNATGPHVT
jgi:hypothetical protein